MEKSLKNLRRNFLNTSGTTTSVVYNSVYSGNRTWRIYGVSDKKHTSL